MYDCHVLDEIRWLSSLWDQDQWIEVLKQHC